MSHLDFQVKFMKSISYKNVEELGCLEQGGLDVLNEHELRRIKTLSL